MSDHALVTPNDWPPARGYSYGVVAEGRKVLHIAGQLGKDPTQEEYPADGFAAQWRQALLNVRQVLDSAGMEANALASMRVYVTSMADYHAVPGRELGAAWVEALGRISPAMTMIEVGSLVDPAALVEIEAVAHGG